jgi:hypothetical protein
MSERHAAQRIQRALPLLRKLVDRLVQTQKFPYDYAGSEIELAENIIVILTGGKVPTLEAERGGAQ